MLDHRQPGPDEHRVRLSRERGAKQRRDSDPSRAAELGRQRNRAERRALRHVPDRRHAAPASEAAQRPDRHLLQADDAGRIDSREPHHFVEKPLRPGGFVLPWKRFQVRTSRRSTVLRMRVASRILLPSRRRTTTSSPPRSHAPVRTSSSSRRRSASGLLRSPTATGGPSCSTRSRRACSSGPAPRLPLKVAEHGPGMASLLRRRPDVLHLQWLAAPELDRLLLRPRVPTVFTAHDLLPRRTARKLSCGAHCSRASTASSCTASVAARRLQSSA